MLAGRVSISIENSNFVERVEQSHVSKIVGLVWNQDPENSISLAALISIGAEHNDLNLVFSIRGKTIRK